MDINYGITDSMPWRTYRRQASRQMSFRNADRYTGEVEYAAAVAAAAFAIKNLESATRDPRGGPRTSLEKTRSQKEPRIARPDKTASRSYTDEKIIRQVPSMKRTPTFFGSNKYSEDTQSWRTEIDTQQIPAFPPQPPPQIVSPPTRRAYNYKPIAQESEADAWERAQLDRIKIRYEKLEKTILEWEDKKRKQAHRKLEKTEGGYGKARAKALQDYHNQIEGITQVAEGARAQAKERRRKEELKVKEKADKFRATGQLPRSCLCFG